MDYFLLLYCDALITIIEFNSKNHFNQITLLYFSYKNNTVLVIYYLRINQLSKTFILSKF